MPDILRKPLDCIDPIMIGGRTYSLFQASDREMKDGTGLWPVGFGMAQVIEDILTDDFMRHGSGRTACVLGDGVGLSSIVASSKMIEVTMIDKCHLACEFAKKNLKRNFAKATVICDTWANVEGSFDHIFGSEVVYSNYGISSMVEFVNRAWNRSGACLFMVQSDRDRSEFEEALKGKLECTFGMHRFPLPSGEIVSCHLWRILG